MTHLRYENMKSKDCCRVVRGVSDVTFATVERGRIRALPGRRITPRERRAIESYVLCNLIESIPDLPVCQEAIAKAYGIKLKARGHHPRAAWAA